MKTRLADLSDFHSARRGMSLNESFVMSMVAARRGSIQPPKSSLSIIVVPVEANHGRWLINCPFCRGAEPADPNDPRFFCLSCGNVKALGEWLQVRWPLAKEKIEAVLLARPEEHQNWKEGETVDDLQAENIKNDLPEEA
jgi:hypothetical protein